MTEGRHTALAAASIAVALLLIAGATALGAGQVAEGVSQLPIPTPTEPAPTEWQSLLEAFVRLPLAALLGAALAMRPRRAGTPARKPMVVQTQIILAVIGALVMIVVGASLARAFGVVGIAGLIRYRAKIDDPKDAGVMLAALGVGLAAGVGLLWLAPFATVFLLALLWVLESQEPQPIVPLTLKVTAPDAAQMRRQVEGVLRRNGLEYELRGWGHGELSYAVALPLERNMENISAALVALCDKNGRDKDAIGVEWTDRKDKS